MIYVRDKPQDGRFAVQGSGDRKIDVRASFMPTLHGERVVLRVLERSEVEYGLGRLGFSAPQLDQMNAILSRPQGLLILTGPTGSGKTTTIYCALRAIVERTQGAASVYTLEDPIEYDLLNINQTQIEESQGVTFASGLRTMLRQDPDVIMVGEVRDLETGRIAIQAGMTGHIIITTVHADRASGVFMRLTEIGVDEHSVASAVTAVVAQRLLRVLCPHCRRPQLPTPGEEARLGQSLAGAQFYGAVGCPQCNMKGYSRSPRGLRDSRGRRGDPGPDRLACLVREDPPGRGRTRDDQPDGERPRPGTARRDDARRGPARPAGGRENE